MKIVPGVRHLAHALERTALTIGNFDGVHLGHQALFDRVLTRASESGGPSAVMTFEPHPVRVLRPDGAFARIFSLEDQRRQAEARGVDYWIAEPFSREFSRLKPERFVLEWIYKPFAPACVVVGYDFAFGESKRGTIEFLRECGDKLGFEVEVVPPVKADGHLVSSTRVRQALGDGDVALAARLLGRRFYLEGLVERGAGRGRTIGWPTANLSGLSGGLTAPKLGVYCAWAFVEGERLMALVNVGVNPTFVEATAGASLPPRVEAHLLGLARDVYGRKLRLEFVDRIRDERRFGSAGELSEQIGRDVAEGRARLEADAGSAPWL